jgi:hypothetical protein
VGTTGRMDTEGRCFLEGRQTPSVHARRCRLEGRCFRSRQGKEADLFPTEEYTALRDQWIR